MLNLPIPVVTIGLLLASNVFMTFAWYGHLKYKETALITVIPISWGIAFSNTSLWCRPTGSATGIFRQPS